METHPVLKSKAYQYSKDRLSGFTLLELMIVISVVAILATVAYPSFRGALAKGDRATGISQISNIAQSLERYYTFNRSYTNDFGDLSMGINDTFSVLDKENLYTYHIVTPKLSPPVVGVAAASDASGQTYSLFATPEARNRDPWIIIQDELGFQQRFSLDDLSTPIDGWP